MARCSSRNAGAARRARREPDGATVATSTSATIASPVSDTLARVSRDVVGCERCPRLRAWCLEVARTKVKRFRDQEYWGRPVPGFGDPEARLLVVGLAPAAHGGNRTGRVFTGDRSGDFLFAEPPPHGIRQPAGVGRSRRRPEAPRLLHRTGRPLRAPRQQADPGGGGALPRVPRPGVGASASRAGRARARPHRHGRLPGDAPRDGPRRAPRPRLRPRRHPRARRRRPALLLVPRVPAEHVHRPPHPARLRRGPRAG